MSFDDSHIKQYKSGATGDFLGGAIHGDEVSDATTNAVIRAITEDEANLGTSLYLCVYFKNTHGSDYIRNPILIIAADTTSPNDWVAVGWGTSEVGTSEQTIADIHTAPDGVAFKTGTDRAGGAILGRDIPPGSYKAMWIRIKVEVGAASQPFNKWILLFDTDNKEGDAPPLSGPGPPDVLKMCVVGEMDCNSAFNTIVSKIKRRSPHRFIANTNMTTKDNNSCWLNQLGGTTSPIIEAKHPRSSAIAIARIGGATASASISSYIQARYSMALAQRAHTGKRISSIRNSTYICFGKQDVKTESLRNSYLNAFSDYKTGVGIDPGYYSRDVYNMHLLFMDTSGYNDYGEGSDQYYWIESDLKKANANPSSKWIIVFTHRAMYASTTSTTSQRYLDNIFRDAYHQMFATYKVHVVVSAYFRNYQRLHALEYNPTTPESPVLFQSGSAPNYNFTGKGFTNACLFIVCGTGGSGTPNHDNFSPAASYMAYGNAVDFGYMLLEADQEDDILKGSFYNSSDARKDSWSITRTG